MLHSIDNYSVSVLECYVLEHSVLEHSVLGHSVLGHSALEYSVLDDVVYYNYTTQCTRIKNSHDLRETFYQ